MNEPQIREALRTFLLGHTALAPDALLVDELNLIRGRSRADLVAVDRRLVGFEIKSRVDNLSRLERQLPDYTAVFDLVYLVLGANHLAAALPRLPSWCGVLLASSVGGQVMIEPFREARTNPLQERFALAQLLWRDEALALLERHGIDRGVRSKPKLAMWERLADRLPAEELSEGVCEALKCRPTTWRTAEGSTPSRPPRPRLKSQRRTRRSKARASSGRIA